MKVCKTAEDLRQTLTEITLAQSVQSARNAQSSRNEQNTQDAQSVQGCSKIGFVPTMGALHKGHLPLVERARAENDIVVVSVFVNPIQFNNPDDLAKYPRTLKADCTLLERAGCDIVFAPSTEEMYPEGKDVAFSRGWTYGATVAVADFGAFDKVMEGEFRPGHFNGVAVVVRRLFELVKPTVAYFGKKDFQQTVIVKSMVQQLEMPVRIEVCPIVREFDGLAMSSRNMLLNHEERFIAPQLYRIMSESVRMGGSVEYMRARVTAELEDYFKVDYFEIVDEDTLQPLPPFWVIGADDATGGCSGCGSSAAVACAAVWLGSVRLIDNISVSRRLGPNETSCAGQCSGD
jgi:pantoate--beta-alanine ligase